MNKSEYKRRNILCENVIRVRTDFVAKDRPHVVETLSTLGPHLARWDLRGVNVDVSLRDRGGKEQRVILHTSLPGLTPLVAVAANPDVTRALCDAKRELIRQIEHQKSAREPMNNRRLGATIRHLDTSARPETIELTTLDAASEPNQQLAFPGR